MNAGALVIMAILLISVFSLGFILYVASYEEPVIEIPIEYPYRDCEPVDFNITYISALPQDDISNIVKKQGSFNMYGVNESSFTVFSYLLSFNEHSNWTLHDSWHNTNVYYCCWTNIGRVRVAFIINNVHYFDTVIVTAENNRMELLHWVQDE